MKFLKDIWKLRCVNIIDFTSGMQSDSVNSIIVTDDEQKQNVSSLQNCLGYYYDSLDEGDHFFVVFENRLGLSKFLGDKDPYTNHVFDSVEGYQNFTDDDIKRLGGRCYARYEMEKMLDEAGVHNRRFYSVLPNLMMPQQIYAEDYLPEEELAIRYTPLYNSPETVFLNECILYDGIIKNGMFHQMANAYIVDCYKGEENDVQIKHVTLSMDRGEENALATVIYANGFVEKKALYAEGQKRIMALNKNTLQLSKEGISIVPLELSQDRMSVTMPYIRAESALCYLRRIIYEDKDLFIYEVEKFLNLILQSSEEVNVLDCNPVFCELGKMYKNVYIDMVPLNAFYEDGQFLFYDQEFCIENYPIGVTLIRAIDIIYMGDKSMEAIVPSAYFIQKYGLSEKITAFRDLGSKFINELRNKEKLADFNGEHLANLQQIYENRERIQYTKREYDEVFLHFDKDLKEKELYVFGAGLWARKFIAEFGDTYKIEALLDNRKMQWGNTLDGIEIKNPDILKECDVKKCKVVVCVKYYTSILAQIKKLGITNYGIYDPNIERGEYCLGGNLDNRLGRTISRQNDSNNFMAGCMNENSQGDAKKYKVGYVAGVFDLFHKGHLNLLRRAKEQCEYLLVGVVSDEQASKNKNRSPFVCEAERREIVEACRYVDKAFVLPFAASGTRDVYKKYHFDVQFSGSDYEKDPYWLAEQKWLREHGADLVFFPYTQSVSSTKLKEKIDSKQTIGE